ncbi:hypothetical protein Leryth_012244 [Lithospermum erythrorhizon]|nr:hypothetical protein Leryth_012244 [Lithospermum erythrorhizon]
MKASIKFRDDNQKPLLRAKVPINILSSPFESSVVFGESKDLALNLSTHFDFGPCFKFSYKPNNSDNPFSFVCKTGIGHYGSPKLSPFVMSAEFDLVGSQNPRFFVHFKPRIGDFLAKKACSSVEFGGNKELVNGVEKGVKNGYFSENGKIGSFSVESAAVTGVGVVGKVLDGMEMSARTILPLGKRAAVNFKWGVRVPAEGQNGNGSDMVMIGRKGDWASGVDRFKKLCPVLVMNKIGIEQVVMDDVKGRGTGRGLSGNGDVAEVCLNMKKQLEVIQAENGLLRKCLDDLRDDIAAGKMNLSFNGSGEGGRYREGERNGWKSSGGGRGDGRANVDKKSSGSNVYGGKGAEEDRHDELKKSLMGAPNA